MFKILMNSSGTLLETFNYLLLRSWQCRASSPATQHACGTGLAQSAALVTTATCDAAVAADAAQLGPRSGSRPLSGVIHASGVLRDGMLQNLNNGAFRQVVTSPLHNELQARITR